MNRSRDWSSIPAMSQNIVDERCLTDAAVMMGMFMVLYMFGDPIVAVIRHSRVVEEVV